MNIWNYHDIFDDSRRTKTTGEKDETKKIIEAST